MGRPLSPWRVRRVFFESVAAGLSVTVAAGLAGVSRPTGYRWSREHRPVMVSDVVPVESSGVRLSLVEREEIAFHLAQGVGVRRIAAVLGRSPSTVSREVRRNRVGAR